MSIFLETVFIFLYDGCLSYIFSHPNQTKYSMKPDILSLTYTEYFTKYHLEQIHTRPECLYKDGKKMMP